MQLIIQAPLGPPRYIIPTLKSLGENAPGELAVTGQLPPKGWSLTGNKLSGSNWESHYKELTGCTNLVRQQTTSARMIVMKWHTPFQENFPESIGIRLDLGKS